jgi:serine/threonine-protein kinase RsbW
LGDEREEAVDVLDDGETLVLYTDGLVERRGESFDRGLAHLAAAAKRKAPDAPTLADDLCEALLDGQSQDDDVCVLTLHRLPTMSMYRHAFPADPAELAGLRESLRAWLGQVGIVEEAERSTVLAVSEAAANAIEHGYGSDGAGIVTVVARLNGSARLEITVRDEGAWRDEASDVDRGRGLLIMQAIVDEFSIVRENDGTVLRMSRSAHEKASA